MCSNRSTLYWVLVSVIVVLINVKRSTESTADDYDDDVNFRQCPNLTIMKENERDVCYMTAVSTLHVYYIGFIVTGHL